MGHTDAGPPCCDCTDPLPFAAAVSRSQPSVPSSTPVLTTITPHEGTNVQVTRTEDETRQCIAAEMSQTVRGRSKKALQRKPTEMQAGSGLTLNRSMANRKQLITVVSLD